MWLEAGDKVRLSVRGVTSYRGRGDSVDMLQPVRVFVVSDVCHRSDSDTTIGVIFDKQHTVLFVRLGWESGVILLYLLCMMLWLVTGGQVVTRTQDSAHWAQPFTGHSQETPLQLTGAAPGPA